MSFCSLWMHQVLQEMQGPSTQVCCTFPVAYFIYCIDQEEGEKLNQKPKHAAIPCSVNEAGREAGHSGLGLDFTSSS